MQAERLEDMTRRGMGRAARMVGEACHVFRPRGAHDPLAVENRFLALHAAFLRAGADQAVAYGQAAWQGVFDAAYTRPGDYLVRLRDRAVWFVVAQEDLLPVICVRAERVVAITRQASVPVGGMTGYGGVTPAGAVAVMSGWPASVLSAGGGGLDRAALPGDTRPGSWRVLLPEVPGVVLRGGDLVTDDLGRCGVIAVAELTALGWRLTVRQATT